MIRILHVLDRDAEFEAERGAESLRRAVGDAFDITRRTIGYGGDWRDVPTAAAMLRRSHAKFDLIHAWGGRALTVAALGASSPIVFSPAGETTTMRTIRWLRAVMSHRRVEVVCPTSTLHRKLVERGVPIERCHLIRPGVEFNRVKRRRDPALRARLGFDETDHVFLAAGESTRAAAHRDAIWATSILHVADPKYKLLVWGRGRMMPSIEHFGHNVMPDALQIAEVRLGRVEFEELLPAADMILVSARGPVATLPIAISMAAALPIVATVTHTVAELLEDRHTALMTAPGKPRMFARRMLDLIEDSSAQWTLSDMARTEAYEYFAFTRFVNQVRSVYRQVVDGDRVEVAQPAPGAGLRFHGRT